MSLPVGYLQLSQGTAIFTEIQQYFCSKYLMHHLHVLVAPNTALHDADELATTTQLNSANYMLLYKII